MRKILFLSTFWVVFGLTGPASQEAAAQCTHFGNQGACPVGIPNGSTSVTVNANGTITWNSGGVSGPCCAAPSGTETGAGLLNLNNQLGGAPFHFGPDVGGIGGTPDPGADPVILGGTSDPETDIIMISGRGFDDRSLGPANCDLGGCTGNDLLGDVFGANPNSGYQCDSGGPGCGNDLWTSEPQPGFGSCGPGGCGGPAPIAALDFSNIPGTGPYAANQTSGNVDPFGGGGSFFMDPLTGESISISENPDQWPDRVKVADRLNTAFVNGEIGYPFNDPEWDQRSVDYYKQNPVEAPVTSANITIPGTSQAFDFYQTADRGTVPAIDWSTAQRFISPYAQNLTQGQIDPFGSAGNNFVDPRTGETTELLENRADWPEKFKKAEELNSLYVSGHINYPFNDPDWENKPANAFAINPVPGSGPAPIVGNERPAIVDAPDDRAAAADNTDKAGQFGIGSDTTLGGAGGLSTRFGGIARNFGLQPSMSSLSLYSTPQQDNSDLTNYVSTILVGIDIRLRGDIGTAFTNKVNLVPVIGGESGVSGFSYYFSDRGGSSSPATVPRANQVPPGTRLPEITRNAEGEFVVFDPNSGDRVVIKDRNLADTIASGVRNGIPLKDAVREAMSNRSVATTGDGLASANPGGVSTPVTPAAPGSAPAPIVGNERPAIIVAPDDKAATADNADKAGRISDAEAKRLFSQRYMTIDGEGTLTVLNRQTGERERFENFAEAEGFQEALRNGMSWNDAMAQVTAARRSAMDRNIIGTIVGRVPNDFRAPVVTDKWDGEIHDIYIDDPATGARAFFRTRQQAEAALDAMRTGASLRDAQAQALRAPTVTRDGLASANSGGVTTPSTPAPAGSAPTFINNRPAIIVPPAVTTTPDGLASANSGGVSTPSTPAPAGSAPTFINNRPAIIVPPTRPAGTSAGTMKGVLAGNAYDIEIIRTPDGKLLAVGTGENANHVFGEVKETSNKLFGDFRREGPWSPPPAKPQTATSTATATTPAVAPAPQAANNRVRTQIANSDRDHMTRNIFLDGFESGNTSAWSSTGR